MRDWFLPLAPVVVVTYFLAFPAHLNAIPKAVYWVQHLVR